MDNNELLLAIGKMMDSKLEPITNDINGMKSDINGIKADIQNVNTRLDKMDARFDKVDERLEYVATVVEGTLDMHDDLYQRVKVLEGMVL